MPQEAQRLSSTEQLGGNPFSVILEHNSGRAGSTATQSSSTKSQSINLSSLVRWLEPLSKKSDKTDHT